jgi:hypothetical protein
VTFDAMRAGDGYFNVSHPCQNCGLSIDGSFHVLRGGWTSVHENAHLIPHRNSPGSSLKIGLECVLPKRKSGALLLQSQNGVPLAVGS